MSAILSPSGGAITELFYLIWLLKFATAGLSLLALILAFGRLPGLKLYRVVFAALVAAILAKVLLVALMSYSVAYWWGSIQMDSFLWMGAAAALVSITAVLVRHNLGRQRKQGASRKTTK
jgi:hypothetical protein